MEHSSLYHSAHRIDRRRCKQGWTSITVKKSDGHEEKEYILDKKGRLVNPPSIEKKRRNLAQVVKEFTKQKTIDNQKRINIFPLPIINRSSAKEETESEDFDCSSMFPDLSEENFFQEFQQLNDFDGLDLVFIK